MSVRRCSVGSRRGRTRPPPVGPCAPITLAADRPLAKVRRLVSSVVGSEGTVEVELEVPAGVAGADASIWVDGVAMVLEHRQGEGDTAVLERTGVVPDVELWWPHTHGEPRLYDLEVVLGSEHIDLEGRIGFRSIEADRSAEAASSCA